MTETFKVIEKDELEITETNTRKYIRRKEDLEKEKIQLQERIAKIDSLLAKFEK